jgi:hypothetical protein
MRRLETENRELREKIAHHMRVYGNMLVELAEMRAKLEMVDYALHGDEQ